MTPVAADSRAREEGAGSGHDVATGTARPAIGAAGRFRVSCRVAVSPRVNLASLHLKCFPIR
jgi:hypothetical protein